MCDLQNYLLKTDEDLILHMHRALLKSQDQAVRGVYTESLIKSTGLYHRRNREFDPVYMVKINQTACNPGFDVVQDKEGEFIILKTITYREGDIVGKKEALRLARAEVIRLEKKYRKDSALFAAKKKAAQTRLRRKAA